MKRISKSESLPKLMQVEGQVADLYWRYLEEVLPKKFGFTSRMHESHQMNSVDQVNTLLNYSYALLEMQVRKALHSAGLEVTIGFLHESRQTKYSLCYDIMEAYRFLADTTVIECLEYDRFSRKDFYRLDNYVLRLKPEAVKKLLDALRIKFNSTVRYRNKFYGWDVIIRLKAQELTAFLLEKRSTVSFREPIPLFSNQFSTAIRKKILTLTSAEAKKQGIGKSTLWYLQSRAGEGKPLRTYNPVTAKLDHL